MAGLNLLPWREAERERKNKQFHISVMFTAILGVGLVVLADHYISQAVDYQQQRNNYLNSATKIVDGKIKEIKDLDEMRQRLLDRMSIIENLQGKRPAIVHLFDEMATALPKGVYLESMRQEGSKIQVEGKSESNARVSSYMKRLDSSPWLDSTDLSVIAAEEPDLTNVNKNNKLRGFKLDVFQRLRKKESS